jgi:hypothetical protein
MPIITKKAMPNFILLSVWLLVVKSTSISGCLWIPGCYIYVDDIVVKTKRGSTLVEDLTLVFDRLQATRTKLNPDKCVFGVSIGKLLGFLVSYQGIEANPEKIKAIEAMRPPARIKDIQKLTGSLATSFQGWLRGRYPSSSCCGSPAHSLGPKRQNELSKS